MLMMSRLAELKWRL